MNYVIVSLRTNCGEFTTDFGKNGNKYFISIFDKETHTFRLKEFERLDEAQIKFCKLAEWCCAGLYSFADRENFLFE